MILVPLFDLTFLNERAAGGAGTSNRRHLGVEPMSSKLDQLRAMTVVVGDTGDIDAVRRLKPQDCTTNPSLVLKAVSTPAGKEILAEAVRWADSLNASLNA